jgi:hypothetical protein
MVYKDSLDNVEFYANSIKAALKRLNEDTITIMACDIPKKYATDDCGLFALAYAIAL